MQLAYTGGLSIFFAHINTKKFSGQNNGSFIVSTDIVVGVEISPQPRVYAYILLAFLSVGRT